MSHDPLEFDIDVDLSQLLGAETVMDGRWYELTQPRPGRAARLQAKLDQSFRNALMCAQWRATARRRIDRRRALRAPLLSRVNVEGGAHLVSTDISMSGMRCSGHPSAPLMDVEFRLPKVGFPVDARVEVVSYKENAVLPWVGLRFAWIDRPYVDCIARYVASRRDKSLKAA
jgi:hypothetical protein